MQWCKEGYYLTDDVRAVDIDAVESLLRSSYWASSRSRRVIELSIENSLNFAVLADGRQIGYARVVTDSATFAWIADVIVALDYRGRGIGTWIVECVLEHPAVAPATLKLLKTRDAHDLYRRFGFETSECMTKRQAI